MRAGHVGPWETEGSTGSPEVHPFVHCFLPPTQPPCWPRLSPIRDVDIGAWYQVRKRGSNSAQRRGGAALGWQVLPERDGGRWDTLALHTVGAACSSAWQQRSAAPIILEPGRWVASDV